MVKNVDWWKGTNKMKMKRRRRREEWRKGRHKKHSGQLAIHTKETLN